MSVANKQKLELTWIGKESRPGLEPRIVLEDPEKSYHSKHLVMSRAHFDNHLIFGDKLLDCKAPEARPNEKRRSLFEAQDKVNQHREELIGKIEKQLKQTSTVQALFTIRWRLL